MNDPNVIARRVKDERRKKHMTLVAVAEKVYVSKSLLSMVEHGKRRLNVDLAVALAKVFGCSAAWLLDLED